MADSTETITLATLSSVSGSVIPGTALVRTADGSAYVPATTANLAAAGVSAAEGVSRDYGSPTGQVAMQTVGVLLSAFSGLGTGAIGPVRANASTGQLERASPLNPGDVLVGYTITAQGDVRIGAPMNLSIGMSGGNPSIQGATITTTAPSAGAAAALPATPADYVTIVINGVSRQFAVY